MAKLKKEQESATIYLPNEKTGRNLKEFSAKELTELSKKEAYKHLFEVPKSNQGG